MSFSYRLIPAAAAACLLVSCGGGGGSAPTSDSPTPTVSRGVAVDGYLKFATVLCDSNGNASTDPGERQAGTNAVGQFSFSPACDDALVVRGGSNADTGLPFGGVLRAPAGATVVSPLSTLLAEGATQAQIIDALGLAAGTDILATDPAAAVEGVLVHPELFRKTLAVQQLLQQAASIYVALSAQSGEAAVQARYATAAASLAGGLAAAAPLISGSSVEPTAVAGFVSAAALAAAAASAFTSTVDAASLGQVSAGALAAQAEAILNASASELTAVTAAAQASTLIVDFVAANVAQLNAPPSAATAALAARLTGMVDPHVALGGDSISLVHGAARTAYTIDQFQSGAGISVSWPLPEPLTLELSLVHADNFTPATGQKLSAAVSITEVAAGGMGTILAYIDDVEVTRADGKLVLKVPATAAAKVYGVSSDGAKKAVIDFRVSVSGVTGSFNTAPGVPTSFPLGNIVNYAINQLSNDFSGIYALRGSYRVSIALSGLSLRRADGALLGPVSIDVPTALNPNGSVAASRSVDGRGLTGLVKLVD